MKRAGNPYVSLCNSFLHFIPLVETKTKLVDCLTVRLNLRMLPVWSLGLTKYNMDSSSLVCKKVCTLTLVFWNKLIVCKVFLCVCVCVCVCVGMACVYF
jgi:hypothetical protein